MDGIVSFGNKRDYEDFKKQLSPQITSIFDLIRDFCFSLGDNVIEDVRMHRIVFCKSITFRWFLDMEPENDSILLKIQKNRKEPPLIINIKLNPETSQLKETIKDAFQTIH
jgi:hypothetical protein